MTFWPALKIPKTATEFAWAVTLVIAVLAFVLALKAPSVGYRVRLGDFVYEPALPEAVPPTRPPNPVSAASPGAIR